MANCNVTKHCTLVLNEYSLSTIQLERTGVCSSRPHPQVGRLRDNEGDELAGRYRAFSG
jgi:hypothetical protein